ncbi:MAG: 30S ribosomal protein S8 [Chlamydiota bacterium]|jgi:small subunit ribosomal protein S8
MSFNDPVAELLTKVRNASRAKHRYVDLALTKMNKSIVDILKEQGFIENFLVNEQKRKVRVFLKYRQRNSLFSNLKRISSPGMRKYVGYSKIPRVKNGLGIAIVSTSKGVLDGESARHQKVGGELLCVVE